MSFNDLTQAAQQHFPKLQVKYKDQSLFMKILSILMFFQKGFMTQCSSSFCNTIYIPTIHSVRAHPVSAAVVFLHELVHLRSSERKAYLSSLYVIWKLSHQLKFKPNLELESKKFIIQLTKPWTSASLLEKEFDIAIHKIKMGQRPYQDSIFDVLDDLITKVS